MDLIKLLITPFYFIYLKWLNFLTIRKYGSLLEAYLLLGLYYFFNYSVARINFEKGHIYDIVNKDELIYGEVPSYALRKILANIPINKNNVFIDLGCGKGKTVFFVNQAYGLRSIGVDVVPTYIRAAQVIRDKMQLENITFLKDNILNTDLSKGNIFLLSWTCFTQKTRDLITHKLEKEIPKDAYVITTTHAIQSACFKELKSIYAPFSWGKGYAYISKKMTCSPQQAKIQESVVRIQKS
ncbi:methyltransferase domain-containing protein [Candidatus Margulisiibacteriota bacterium]